MSRPPTRLSLICFIAVCLAIFFLMIAAVAHLMYGGGV